MQSKIPFSELKGFPPFSQFSTFEFIQQCKEDNPPWMTNYASALSSLSGNGQTNGDSSTGGGEWAKPSQDTDKLFMSVGPNTIIEVGHPAPKKEDRDLRYAATTF